ncbi:MAG: DNA ligase [Betaproteobacteria bacterium HGW-Betaproteobacteria-11]|nr:MAG: DNA ligase [Betaproteobacteria bacterium HGW-Betaproteobacteria-11]
MRGVSRIGVILAVLLGATAAAEPPSPPTSPPSRPAVSPPDILLAKVWRDEFDPAAFWVSEKLDGVRALWDGRQLQLRFRSGRPVHAPPWFIAALPARPLDGELWLGRGRFAELAAIVRKTEPVEAEWRQVRYMIFELPDAAGSFSERVTQIRTVTEQAQLPWLAAVPQFRVADRAELLARYAEVIGHDGEGLMLHRAEALYHGGRSDDLLKLKPALDAEAVVIAHLPGKGRLAEQLGALEVETADGRRFRIGSGLSDAERRHPPPIGATITYRYQELSRRGIPRFPRYWRVREEF